MIESTKPRSSERRRRVPRMRIQPETNAVDAVPKRRVQGESASMRRRDDQSSGIVAYARWMAAARFLAAIETVVSLYRAMATDGADGGIEGRQHALRLAQWIAEQHAGLAGFRDWRATSLRYRRSLSDCGGPAEYRQREGGFGHKRVATERLERRAGRVGREFIVARNHPHFAAALEANLRRAEHVARGMKRERHIADSEAFAISQRLNRRFGAHTRAQQRLTSRGGEVSE